VDASLREFTTYVAPDEIHLVLFEGRAVDPALFASAWRLCAESFGRDERRPAWAAMPPIGERISHSWVLKPVDIPRAIALLGRIGPIPSDGFAGPIFLGLRGYVRLCDPETTREFPNQGAELYGNQEVDFGIRLGLSLF
jgi:hypothetical protein